MNRSSIGRHTSDGSNAAAALEIIAGNRGCFVRELQISLAAATATTLGVGRPAAAGITPTTPVLNLLEGTRGTPLITTAIAWGTGPTVPASFFRRVTFPATVGSQVLWKFDSGIFLAPAATLVIWNLAANGLIDVAIVVDEQ